jgi:hypothetical protein
VSGFVSFNSLFGGFALLLTIRCALASSLLEVPFQKVIEGLDHLRHVGIGKSSPVGMKRGVTECGKPLQALIGDFGNHAPRLESVKAIDQGRLLG